MVIIQRSRRRFGMKLNGQHRQLLVCEPLNRAIVEIDETHFPSGSCRYASRIDFEPMVLRGDRDLSGSHVSHRVVPATMPELQFSSLGSNRSRQQLVAQTNAEVGNLLLNDPSHNGETSVEVGRVTWSR